MGRKELSDIAMNVISLDAFSVEEYMKSQLAKFRVSVKTVSIE